ncbi:hypothetical protein NDR87_18790 [Nocardia sp. CDC159]|uniref:Uncharacterized protein n=1 Tax=Nocardia pulmonis TaxID=2951408 RepID=A0A9X2E8I1_9NOCA|nr:MULTISPECIES: hypothetical protein [Nocardia]MCM6776262.1 hypothetical protein [Nocardia pulmonis]MCM6788412.1 hypothetical protein [Nocardia sp. CDC159]
MADHDPADDFVEFFEADWPSGIPVGVHASRYTVTCLPIDHFEAHLFSVHVEYTGRGRWAVRRLKRCYDINGKPDWESIPSERTDEWLDRFRFDRDTALAVARRVAPTLIVNGTTVPRALARIAAEAADAG